MRRVLANTITSKRGHRQIVAFPTKRSQEHGREAQPSAFAYHFAISIKPDTSGVWDHHIGPARLIWYSIKDFDLSWHWGEFYFDIKRNLSPHNWRIPGDVPRFYVTKDAHRWIRWRVGIFNGRFRTDAPHKMWNISSFYKGLDFHASWRGIPRDKDKMMKGTNA